MQDIQSLDPNFATKDLQDGLLWFDLEQFTVEGRGWTDTAMPYDRLPARARDIVRPPLWQLSQHSAGIAARFVADAQSVSMRWTLRFESFAMPDMPATGVSGLDVYYRDDVGRWRWIAVGTPHKFPQNAGPLLDGLSPGPREYLLYLPLYNGVTKVEIGVAPGATLAPAPLRPEALSKPICFYGTSVTHGACASRPGMTYAAMLGRMLDRPHINLGFSGNGKTEIEVANFLAELDPCVYVLDSLPNTPVELLTERLAPFVRTLCAAHPRTPIVLIESIIYQGSSLIKDRLWHPAKNAALHVEYQRLLDEGVKGLHLVPCDDLLGDDSEGTVDGIHPTDLGFYRIANVLRPVLERALRAG